MFSQNRCLLIILQNYYSLRHFGRGRRIAAADSNGPWGVMPRGPFSFWRNCDNISPGILFSMKGEDENDD
jgi:hypothetical protein